MIEIMHLHKIPGIQMRLNWYVKYGKILLTPWSNYHQRLLQNSGHEKHSLNFK